jgi:hypothetical protein
VSFTPLFLKFKDILYNFDDTLVKKVQRVKCKEEYNTPFLGSTTPNSVSSASIFSASGSTSTRSGTESGSGSLVSSTTSSDIEDLLDDEIMLLQKTNQPDIYDVFSPNSKEHMGFACVNNIQTSKLLRSCFLNKTLIDKIKFKCSYNKKFAKWNPVEPICV